MNVNDFLRDEFISAWYAKTSVSIVDYIVEVRSAFNISNIHDNVNIKINEAYDKATQERYQRNVLRELARQYADELYTLSDNGQNITESIILQAKSNLKGRGCEIQPC